MKRALRIAEQLYASAVSKLSRRETTHYYECRTCGTEYKLTQTLPDVGDGPSKMHYGHCDWCDLKHHAATNKPMEIDLATFGDVRRDGTAVARLRSALSETINKR